MSSQKVCIGEITTVHGVRGQVKVRSFTDDPAAIKQYTNITDEGGKRRFQLTFHSQVKDAWIASIKGIDDRTAAEALRGTCLYVDRTDLPETEADEYYHSDLVGLKAQNKEGAAIGTVIAVHNFGAGDILEIRLKGQRRTEMLPFINAFVPEVRVQEGLIILDPPYGWLESPEPEGEGE